MVAEADLHLQKINRIKYLGKQTILAQQIGNIIMGDSVIRGERENYERGNFSISGSPLV